MKKIIVFIAFINFAQMVISQNKVILKNKQTIKKAKLYKLNEQVLTYEKEGSLHDILKTNVLYVVIEGERFSLDELKSPISIKNTNDSIVSNNKVNIALIEKEDEKIEAKNISNTKQTITAIETDVYSKNILYFYPLSLLESDPNLYLGYELKINTNLSFIQSAGLYFNNPVSLQTLSGRDIKHGIKLNSELKYYYNNINHKRRNYYGCGLMAKQVNYKDNSYNLYENDNVTGVVRNEEVKKILALNFIVGRQYIHENLIIDIYVGAGIRVKHISEKNSSTNTDYFMNYGISSNYEYNQRMPNICAGIRFGLGW